jgi:GNAT superfamily N-acetyltransferase
MQRELPGGYVLDDDRARVDLDVVHGFLSAEAYWAVGRERALTDAAVAGSRRVLGLYAPDGSLAGFARAVSDGALFAYLADVFVLPAHRGRGLGVALVREMVLAPPLAGLRWVLFTADAQELYGRLGFEAYPLGEGGMTLMQRRG